MHTWVLKVVLIMTADIGEHELLDEVASYTFVKGYQRFEFLLEG